MERVNIRQGMRKRKGAEEKLSVKRSEIFGEDEDGKRKRRLESWKMELGWNSVKGAHYDITAHPEEGRDRGGTHPWKHVSKQLKRLETVGHPHPTPDDFNECLYDPKACPYFATDLDKIKTRQYIMNSLIISSDDNHLCVNNAEIAHTITITK